MSKTLSTEMSVDQLRRHISERSRQVPTERGEIEEAEILLQAKLLDQTNNRLDQLTAALEQLRTEVSPLLQVLQDGADANRGLQRSVRRYARWHTMATLLLLVAAAVVVRVGWIQMEQADVAYLQALKRPGTSVQSASSASTDKATVAAASASARPASGAVTSPYHLQGGQAQARASTPVAPSVEAVDSPKPAEARVGTSSTTTQVVATPAVATLGPEVLGPSVRSDVSVVLGQSVLGPAPQPVELIKAVLGSAPLGPELPVAPTIMPWPGSHTPPAPPSATIAPLAPITPMPPSPLSAAPAGQSAPAAAAQQSSVESTQPAYISIWRSEI
jgi:hypothetical protein